MHGRLNHIIVVEVHNGTWKRVKVSRQGPALSHLFFVDDLVLFVKVLPEQVGLDQCYQGVA